MVRDHLVLITSPGAEKPSETTTIDPGLVEMLVQDLRGGDDSRRMCYYDPATDSVKDGIPFRVRSSNDK